MYDLVVLGGGPAGYLAAERAGARGLSVAVIEKAELGGVCLNEGCIPTKTLLNSAKLYRHAKESAQFGVHASGVTYSLPEIMAWKEKVVSTMVRGIHSMMKRHKVEVVSAEGRFTGPRTVAADGKNFEGRNILIASGSSTAIPPIPGAEGANVLTSRELLSIKEMPRSLVVIGGGVIGMEFASFFSCMDVKVTVIEMMPEIIPFMEAEHAKLLRREMKDVTFHLQAKVKSIEAKKVRFEKDGKEETAEGDIILLAVGRRPNVKDLGFEKIGLDVKPGGVMVNEYMETNIPGVYAAGDVTGKSLLAHSAYRMGEVAVDRITGGTGRMRYNAVPWAAYTYPEGAGCGITEAQALEKGHKVKTASLQMRVNGRFLAENGSKGGLCKVVSDAETGMLLGVHMLGGACSEMMTGPAAMIEAELRMKDIKEIIYTHPSVSEIVKDTVWELE